MDSLPNFLGQIKVLCVFYTSHSLPCIWLATASLPSTMRPGRSGGLIRLIRSNEESDEREATERNEGRACVTLPPVTGLEYGASMCKNLFGIENIERKYRENIEM